MPIYIKINLFRLCHAQLVMPGKAKHLTTHPVMLSKAKHLYLVHFKIFDFSPCGRRPLVHYVQNDTDAHAVMPNTALRGLPSIHGRPRNVYQLLLGLLLVIL